MKSPTRLQGFPERFQEAAYASGLTDQEIGDRCGKGRKTILAYRHGESTPDCLTLARLCFALGVSADFLLFGKPQKTMKLYMRTTTDRLELPIAVAGSAKELAEMTGTTPACVLSSISHGHKGWCRVEVEDEDAEMHDVRRQDLR